MPVPVDPYTFADGPGNTASGVQVNQRFAPLYNTLNPASVGIDYQNVQTGGIRETNMATGVNGLAKGCFSAYRNAALSLTSGSQVTFDAEEFDPSNWFAAGQFNPQVPGFYRLSWSVSPLNVLAADQYWYSMLRKNVVGVAAGMIGFQRATIPVMSAGSRDVQANGTTDTFDVTINHNAGAAVALQTGPVWTYFSGELIGRS
jgi:hypothetical protein